MILVTGGAGFIGSHFVQQWLAGTDEPILNLDLLTYAANPARLKAFESDARHLFVQGDIADGQLVGKLLERHRPRAVVHFAAETHVDRSIDDAGRFVATNIVGTFRLLEAVRAHWSGLPDGEQAAFRFVQVSTDEVYGEQDEGAAAVKEDQVLAPGNPYSASKAAADHLVLAWLRTHDLPVLITRSSNNYGPCQFPEKFIPRLVACARAGLPLPVYGDGRQRRDWLHVGDHCRAIACVLAGGRVGSVYNIAAGNEQVNLAVCHAVCRLLDELAPRSDGRSHAVQIAHVGDRPGHDRRYAIDACRIRQELGWRAAVPFESGLRAAVAWYLAHPEWTGALQEPAA